LRTPRAAGPAALAFFSASDSTEGGCSPGRRNIGFFNEMYDGASVRPAYAKLVDWVESTPPEVLSQ
jgi:hypothetical protein